MSTTSRRSTTRYGHAVGDRALQAIAETLRASTRVFDSLARYGGEEFVVVMPGPSPDEAVAAAERLRVAVEAMIFEPEPGRLCHLSVSIGVCCGGPGVETPEALLRNADIALYAAKRAGRNRVELAVAANS